MSIEKTGIDYVLECDICGEMSFEYFETFYEAVDAKRELGWSSKKSDGIWYDMCPDCTEREKEKRKNESPFS